MPEATKQGSAKFVVAVALAAAFGAAFLTVSILWLLSRTESKQIAATTPSATTRAFPDSCNTVDLQIYGDIVSTSADIPISDTISANDGAGTLLTPNYTTASAARYALDNAKSDPNIKALLIDINSNGGVAEAGEELATIIHSFGKPTVAVIHDSGLSAAYLIAASADKVYAMQNSDVGSIGATNSFLNYAEKDKKDGIVYEQLSSGPYKDMYSPDKPLTDDERALIQKQLATSSGIFVQKVAEYRHQDVARVQALADGSAMLGQEALDKKLIDTLGTRADALKYLESKIGDTVSPCWY